jgi:hypothetical protein
LWNRKATDDNMAHVHSVLDTQGYKHTLTICNTYCFSTAIMVVRTRLAVTLYVVYIHTWPVLLSHAKDSGHLATILREIQYLSLLQLLNYRCSSMHATLYVVYIHTWPVLLSHTKDNVT